MRITQNPTSIRALMQDQHFATQNPCDSFDIPIYQRPYSWDKEQCEETFDDMIAWIRQYTEDKSEEELSFMDDHTLEFYMGLIITARSSSLSSLGQEEYYIEIVDGQQRITTLSIALCTLHNLLSPYSEVSRDVKRLCYTIRQTLSLGEDQNTRLIPQFPKDKKHFQALVNHILYNTTLSNDTAKSTMGKNFKIFKSLFEQEINKEDSDEARLNRLTLLARTLINTRFLVLETEGKHEKLNLFKTLNSRGVALSEGDLIKNSIYEKLLSSDALDHTGYSDVIHQWNELRDSFQKSNAFDKSIYYYINSLTGLKGICSPRFGAADQIIREKLMFNGLDHYIDHLFEQTETDQRSNVIETFATDLMEGLQLAYEIMQADTEEVDNIDFDCIFQTLKDFSVKKSYPLVNYIYRTFKQDYPQETFKMLEWLEAMVVRFLVAKEEPRPLTEFFHGLMFKINEVFNETDHIEAVLDCVYQELSQHPVFTEQEKQEAFTMNLNAVMASNRVSSLYRRLYFNEYQTIKKIPLNKADGVRLNNYYVKPKSTSLEKVYDVNSETYKLLQRPTTPEEKQARGEAIAAAIEQFFVLER